MRFIPLFFALTFSISLHSQKIIYFFSGSIGVGMMQQEYHHLGDYPYLFGQPKNINFMTGGIFNLGLRDRFFVSLSAFRASKSETVNYLNKDTRLNAYISSIGIYLNAPIYKKESSFFNHVYLSLGVKKVITEIQSFTKASVGGSIYEYSDIDGNLACTKLTASLISYEFEIMKSKMLVSLDLFAGYDFKLNSPSWSGIYHRNPGDENHPVNLGGFNSGVNLTFWSGKEKRKNDESRL